MQNYPGYYSNNPNMIKDDPPGMPIGDGFMGSDGFDRFDVIRHHHHHIHHHFHHHFFHGGFR